MPDLSTVSTKDLVTELASRTDDKIEKRCIDIACVVADHYDVPMPSILGKRGTRSIATARKITAYLCYMLQPTSIKSIGKLINRNDTYAGQATELILSEMNTHLHHLLKICDTIAHEWKSSPHAIKQAVLPPKFLKEEFATPPHPQCEPLADTVHD